MKLIPMLSLALFLNSASAVAYEDDFPLCERLADEMDSILEYRDELLEYRHEYKEEVSRFTMLGIEAVYEGLKSETIEAECNY